MIVDQNEKIYGFSICENNNNFTDIFKIYEIKFDSLNYAIKGEIENKMNSLSNTIVKGSEYKYFVLIDYSINNSIFDIFFTKKNKNYIWVNVSKNDVLTLLDNYNYICFYPFDT